MLKVILHSPTYPEDPTANSLFHAQVHQIRKQNLADIAYLPFPVEFLCLATELIHFMQLSKTLTHVHIQGI